MAVNPNLLKALAAFPSIPMLLNGVGFILDPEKAAASLGMPLLDGLGRSTQVGDFSAFFLMTGLVILAGAITGQRVLLFCGAAYLGGAAFFRSLAAILHEAEFAVVFITVEVILAVWLLGCAYLLKAKT